MNQRKKRAYEQPALPNIANLGGQQETVKPMLAKCPGCGLSMAVLVTPQQISYNIHISSDPDEIEKIKNQNKYRGKIFGGN